MENLDKHLDKKMREDDIRQNVDFLLKNEFESRIHEDEFEGVEAEGILFTKESIKKDKLLVQSIKKNFQKHIEHLDHADIEKIIESKKRADALEVAVAEIGELFNWAGENAYFIRSSEYDDLVNGVDIIIEFDVPSDSQEEPKRIALAIDASMKTESRTISKKIDRNVEKLLEKQHGSFENPGVKYFKSSATSYSGPLPFIIPVVVGLEGKNANELISLYVSMKKLRKISGTSQSAKESLNKINEKLEKHPSQGVFYKEVMEQLRYYSNLLKGVSEKERVLSEGQSIVEQFQKISSQKERIELGDYEQDAILALVREITQK